MECPLCSRTFPLGRIEAHASSCDGSAKSASSSSTTNNCAFTRLMMGGKASTSSSSRRTESQSRSDEGIINKVDNTDVILLVDEDSMPAKDHEAKGQGAIRDEPMTVDHEVVKSGSTSSATKRSLTDVLMSTSKRLHGSKSIYNSTPTPASASIENTSGLRGSDPTPTSKRILAAESSTAETENVEEDSQAKHRSVDKGPSAFAIMMSAAAELSRPECFLFDFATKRTEWRDTCPSDLGSAWTRTVKLGRGVSQFKVTLVGLNLPSQEVSAPLTCDPVSRLSVGMLKSNMQKAFRRRDSSVCRKAACELAVKSWNDFVRRVPIVVLEDGIIASTYSALVWIMLAESVGLEPSRELALFVVDVIASAADQTLLDSNGWTAGFDATKSGDVTRADLHAMNHPNHAAIVFSLKARGLFGGMGGDVMMCKAYARVWHSRLTGVEGPEVRQAFETVLEGPRPSTPSRSLIGFDRTCDLNALSPGVDFHSQPPLFDGIIKSHHVSTDEFRSAMWKFRSGLNYRGHVETTNTGQAIVPLKYPSDDELRDNMERCLKIHRGFEVELDDGGQQQHLYDKVWRKVALDCDRVSLEFLRPLVS